MKRLALTSALSLAASILIAPMSLASGFIIIDPAVSGGIPIPHVPIVPHRPGITPGHNPTDPSIPTPG
ncbi:hypothetical protein, partial [Enterococcus faecium]